MLFFIAELWMLKLCLLGCMVHFRYCLPSMFFLFPYIGTKRCFIFQQVFIGLDHLSYTYHKKNRILLMIQNGKNMVFWYFKSGDSWMEKPYDQ